MPNYENNNNKMNDNKTAITIHQRLYILNMYFETRAPIHALPVIIIIIRKKQTNDDDNNNSSQSRLVIIL